MECNYASEFRSEINRMIDIEKILKKYEVKCRDLIGLVQELNDLHRHREEAP